MSHDPVYDGLPRPIRSVRALWQTNPFVVFAVTFLLGALPSIYAVFASTIGDVVYLMPVAGEFPGADLPCSMDDVRAVRCIEKQVGYSYAINWWPSLVILMPLALFFAFESVQSLQKCFERMRRDRMFHDPAWSPAETSRLVQALATVVRQVWTAFLVSGAIIFLLVATVVALDWYCVVNMPLILERPLMSLQETGLSGVCSNPNAQENDWSIAATFGKGSPAALAPGYRPPGWLENYVFSAYVYLLLLIEMGVLLTYFCFIGALSFTIYNIRKEKFDLRVAPNFLSNDRRCRMGFENFERVFRPCVYIVIFSFIMAFCMRIQNEYLRRDDYTVIYEFLFADIRNALRSLLDIQIDSIWGSLVGTLEKLRKVIDVGLFEDPNSLLGSPLVIIVFALVSIALGVVLRDTARDSKASVLDALKRPESCQQVEAFYGMPGEEIAEKLDNMRFWPLSWPRLKQARNLIMSGLLFFVFYRLAFLWVGLVALRAIQGELGTEDEGEPSTPPPARGR